MTWWVHYLISCQRSEVNDMVGSFRDIMSEVKSQCHCGFILWYHVRGQKSMIWWVHSVMSCQRWEVIDRVGSFCDIMSEVRSNFNMVGSFSDIITEVRSHFNDMVGSFPDIMSEVSSQWHGGFITWYHVRGQKSMTWWVHSLISCQKSMTWWVLSMILCQRSEVNDMVGSFPDIMSEVRSQSPEPWLKRDVFYIFFLFYPFHKYSTNSIQALWFTSS